jgi:Tfp pilus assembly protein PilF
MLEFIIIIIAAISLVFTLQSLKVKKQAKSPENKKKLTELWDLAQTAMRKRAYIPAEKALLAILQIDHRNAAAYNRLGILYAKQQQFDDAIVCFEIATSISPTASSLHNLGLVYYENEKFEKAARVLEQALAKEALAVRYIAHAKALNALLRFSEVTKALEKAVALEENPQTLELLVEAHEKENNLVLAEEVRTRLLQIVSPTVIQQSQAANIPKASISSASRSKTQDKSEVNSVVKKPSQKKPSPQLRKIAARANKAPHRAKERIHRKASSSTKTSTGSSARPQQKKRPARRVN